MMMHFFKYLLLYVIGFSAGFITAASYVAFIAMIGIFPKIAAKTKTAKQCILYENCLILGILLATFLQFFSNTFATNSTSHFLPPPIIGIVTLIIIGLFGGIYIGFLIGGLSEVLNTIPIFARKAKLTNQVSYIILFLSLGKLAFTILQFYKQL
jgi:stage V sporulation protein AB